MIGARAAEAMAVRSERQGPVGQQGREEGAANGAHEDQAAVVVLDELAPLVAHPRVVLRAGATGASSAITWTPPNRLRRRTRR